MKNMFKQRNQEFRPRRRANPLPIKIKLPPFDAVAYAAALEVLG